MKVSSGMLALSEPLGHHPSGFKTLASSTVISGKKDICKIATYLKGVFGNVLITKINNYVARRHDLIGGSVVQ